MGYFLGVDLGTTYTAAATRRGGHTEIAALSDRSSMVPSVLFLRDDDTILVGEAANRRGVTEPGRVAREFKRRFGDSAPLLVGGSPYGADVLTSRLLRWVVDRVAEREGEPPERIAVTHPANWGEYKLDLLRQAVRHADLDQGAASVTVSEPQAAATWYATQERVEPGEVVAVYDLGGGTFDAAVLKRTVDGFELLGSPEGVERLGGIDFDAAVLAHVGGVLGSAWDALDPEDPPTRAAVARLRQECVEAKEALSSDNQVSIPVVLPGIHTEVRLTRAELEDMVRPALAESVACVRRALRGAGVEADEVARVLLVGGSSRIPLVSEVIGGAFGRPIAVDAHPKNAVALGAAVAASTAPGAATDPTPSGVVPVVPLGEGPGSPDPSSPAGPPLSAGPSDPPDAAGPPAGASPSPGITGTPAVAARALPENAAGPDPAATVRHDAQPARGQPAEGPGATIRQDTLPAGGPSVSAPATTHGRPPRGPDPRPPVTVPAPPTPRRSPPPVAPPTRRPATASSGRAEARAGGPSGQHRRPPTGRPPATSGGRDGRRVVTITMLVVVLIAIAGVAGALVLQPDDDDGGTARTTTTATGPTTTSEPPPSQDADDNGRIDDPGAPPGHEEPPPATTAPEVASLNHAVHDGFERVSIRFTGDLPPAATLVRDPDRGLLRLDFPDVDPTGVENGNGDAMAQVFGGDSELGLSAFFVLDRDGNAFVDIHADTPVTAEHFRLIIEDGDRPVIAIDFQEDASGGTWNPSQVDAAGGVILEPIPNASLVGTTSLHVEGYGRRDDGAGVVEVIDSTGAAVGSTDVAVPAAGRANGLFGTDVSFAEPLVPGTYTIRFSGSSPDGSPAAVDTTVDVQ